jgi:hypothetical protein
MFCQGPHRYKGYNNMRTGDMLGFYAICIFVFIELLANFSNIACGIANIFGS